MDSAAVQPIQKAYQVIAKRKAVQGHDTRTATKKTNIDNIMNAIKLIAACARQVCAKSRFNAKAGTMAVPRRAPCKSAGDWWLMAIPAIPAILAIKSGKLESTLKRGCDSIHAGALNTLESAHNRRDRTVFSRQKFAGTGFPVSHGFGRDGLVRKAGRMADSMFRTSRPPVARLKAASGLQSQSGAETMTKVNTTTTPKAAPRGIAPAKFPASIERQFAIETALADALYYIRMPYSDKTLNAATARTRRALTLLKQACEQAKNGGAQ